VISLYDLNKLLEATKYAADNHVGQQRKDPRNIAYINHPISVMEILSNTGGVGDVSVLISAALHDLIEDTIVTYEDIVDRFGKHVADIVQEVSDDKSLPKSVRKKLQIEHASSISIEAKLIKLGDKISNVRDIGEAVPIGWSVENTNNYIEWAKQVVYHLRGINKPLEDLFDKVYNIAIDKHKIK